MELALKISAFATVIAVISLIIKRSNPELSALLTLAAAAVIFSAAIISSEGLRELLTQIKALTSETGRYLSPVVKCTAVGVITKISSELCRDASQSALASAVELAGTLCAFAAAAPMMLTLIGMIGDMV